MKQTKGKILWVDDEIDHLKSHILFLEGKGYSVTPVSNAEDAIDCVRKASFDMVLLDEMMPGKDGLHALREIKQIDPSLPVVMVTKSEEEDLMEQAIGGDIEDYLTKPVNPSQILSSCKRILEKRRISRDKITRDYTAEFAEISSLLGSDMTPETWADVHLRLSEREIELDDHPDLGLHQIIQDQRRECNQAFGRYVENEYLNWLTNKNERPVMSMDVVSKYVLPAVKSGKQVLFLVIDNLRLDQWLVIESLLYDYFSIQRDYYYSILPTATPYSRNSLFAGLLPAEIEKKYPEYWIKQEADESSRNRYEQQLLTLQLEREGITFDSGIKYAKIMDVDEAKAIEGQKDVYLSSPLSALVYNFVDIIAHRRSDSEILREIIPDEGAFRSLTKTWFERSFLFEILKAASKTDIKVIITSDHGSIRCMRGSTVHADKETSTNVRYKYGRSIRGESKQAFEIKDPQKFGLPESGLNINFLIAKEDYYFVYPTNYHKYLALYRDSFQHGGISMEEMILPVITLERKKQ